MTRCDFHLFGQFSSADLNSWKFGVKSKCSKLLFKFSTEKFHLPAILKHPFQLVLFTMRYSHSQLFFICFNGLFRAALLKIRLPCLWRPTFLTLFLIYGSSSLGIRHGLKFSDALSGFLSKILSTWGKKTLTQSPVSGAFVELRKDSKGQFYHHRNPQIEFLSQFHLPQKLHW